MVRRWVGMVLEGAEPVWVGNPLTISCEGVRGGIDPQVGIAAIRVHPAFMPVDCGLHARIFGLEGSKRLPQPGCLAA